MTATNRMMWPLSAGVVGAGLLTVLYLGIVSWAESLEHAIDLFWADRWIVIPIILGFGAQMALYVILKKQLFLPVAHTGLSTSMTGVSGGMSAAAMVACCAHHVTDLLPILGLTAATAFLAEYRTAFMLVGLGTTVVGILIMIIILMKEREKARHMLALTAEVM